MSKLNSTDYPRADFASYSNELRLITNLLLAIFFVASTPLFLEYADGFISSHISLLIPLEDYTAIFVWSTETLQWLKRMIFLLSSCLVVALPFGVLLSARHNNFALICAMLAGVHLGINKLTGPSSTVIINGSELVIDLLMTACFFGLSIILGGYFRRQLVKYLALINRLFRF